jgi:glyoxylase-like metal-dependent hydrolase (beta-lactamase superfamily II)
VGGSIPRSLAGQATDVYRLVPLGDRIWVSVTRDGINPSAYANSVVIAGDSAVMVVDTRFSQAAGERLVRSIRSVTTVPVRWVVNTHFHTGHVGGNRALAREWPGARILGHPSTVDSLVTGGDLQLAQELERLSRLVTRLEGALEGGELPPEAVPAYRAALRRYRTQRQEVSVTTLYPPDDPVTGERVIHLGNRDVVVLHPGPAHTAGDLVVWVPDTRFLAAGDLLEEGPLGLQGADVRGWAGALAALRALDPALVLPAHGRVREDAALLYAHAGFLLEALALASAGMPGSTEGMVDVLQRHQAALAPFGVSPARFEAYVAAVRSAVTTGRRE